MAVLDNYERKARLTPGLYAVLPFATTVTTLGLDKFPVIAGLAGLLTTAGGAWVLATLVGDLGRKTQPGLFDSWGGSPTTTALRLSAPCSNPAQRDAWRAAVQARTGVVLATAEEEAADASSADQRIITATSKVLHLGHADGVPAVQNENVAFGYQRNMFGFRHVGRGIAAVCIAVQLGAIFGPWVVSTGACVTGAVVSGAFLLLWLFLPSQERTKLAGERYARQLFIAAANGAG